MLRSSVARWVVGRRIESVRVLDARSVRRHDAGPVSFVHELDGAVVEPPTPSAGLLCFGAGGPSCGRPSTGRPGGWCAQTCAPR